MPKVSVVMSAYNAERYVGEAVDSVLAQTFRDFELIVIDDCSTDRTGEILSRFQDDRIRWSRNNENFGLTRSLNKGLQLATGEYIARLDADDVALPERLERQVRFLESHPEVGLVGSTAIYIDPNGRELGVQKVRTKDFRRALLGVEFVWEHSSALFRAVCIDAVGLYREEFTYAQDYDLWLRIADKFEIAVICEPLIKLRLHRSAISIDKRIFQRAYVLLAVELAEQRKLTGHEDKRALLEGVADIESRHPDAFAPDEIGRAHLRNACVGYLLGDIAAAKQAMSDAVLGDPSLPQHPMQLLWRIVLFGYNYAATLKSESGAVEFLERVFAHLPPAADFLHRFKSNAIADLHIAFASDFYERGELSSVRRNVMHAVARKPAWLRNRWVWYMFVTSFFRSKRAHREMVLKAA